MYEYNSLSDKKIEKLKAVATSAVVRPIVEDDDGNCYPPEDGEEPDCFSVYALVDGLEEWMADYPDEAEASRFAAEF